MVVCSISLASDCLKFSLCVHEGRKFGSIHHTDSWTDVLHPLRCTITSVLSSRKLFSHSVSEVTLAQLQIKGFFPHYLHRGCNANGSLLKCIEAQRRCELCPNLFCPSFFFFPEMSFQACQVLAAAALPHALNINGVN